MIPRFQYFEPGSLREACAILQEKGAEARPLAGGTDLLVKMKDRKVKPQFLVNLKRVPDLDEISWDGGLRLGAMTSMHALETSSAVKENYPALAYAASTVGSVQIRNLATVGGNLCNAAPSADTAPPLVALSATAFIRGARGRRRRLSLEDFFLGPGQTALQAGEVLTELRLPPMPPGSGASYLKLTIRQAMDIALVGVSALVQLNRDGSCQDCRIVLGAVAPIPLRARKAEEVLRGQKLTLELMRRAGEVASGESRPITDIRASAEYRREMVKVFTRRALEQATEQARKRS